MYYDVIKNYLLLIPSFVNYKGIIFKIFNNLVFFFSLLKLFSSGLNYLNYGNEFNGCFV